MKTYGRSLAIGFALAFAVLCIVGGLAVRSAFLMEHASARANQSHQALRDLTTFADALTVADTTQRSYILSNDRVYLEPFEKAVLDIRERLAAMKASAIWMEHASVMDAVDEDVPGLINLYRERIAQRATLSLDEVTRHPKAAESRRRLETLRKRLSDLEAAEVAVLDARTAEMTDTTRLVKRVSIGGVVAGLALVAWIGVALQRRLMQTIGGAAMELTGQVRDLRASSQLQAGAAKETASAAVQLSSTMHEVQAAAKQIAQRSSEVEDIAAASTRAAQAGSQAMLRARDTVGAMRGQIDRVVEHMTALGREVQGAATVLTTVEELAERTNILAINATIEAFAAGEAGQRFQVVAEEIRRLAEKMRTDAMDIKSQLESIRNSSNATIMSTEAGFKAVEASSTLFGEVDAALDLIAARVVASDTASREIRMATLQQSTAAQQLETALSEVNRATLESEGASRRNLETASAVAATADRLSAFVAPPKELVAMRRMVAV
ncbi:methyl-accepting chemotaxis protein [Roseateles chitosanitabidus]|jgi:CHASE3 domain sensor protein|uniref:methyl-accepting chemotaxis protein n=1 Tax=Roseateles chitosanitabidus TaxID=65048 RepID=UPI00082F7B93|nr:methyl-accepting chemotaxis protein [Roseateles chitosanitabidus]MBO9689124.1 CHASE3 domain-containing protein [Roseateles chitosanitabidus]